MKHWNKHRAWALCVAGAGVVCLAPTPLQAAAEQPSPATEGGELKDLFQFIQEERIFESEQVVTAASKQAVSSDRAPSIVTVISRATIETMGYQSVPEALQWVPGLYVIDDLVTQNVGVRGVIGTSDSWSRLIKVLVDGHPITYYPALGALMGPELIPIDAVESIEVIRGPGSALYGANAFLGVVNIVTRKPAQSTGRVSILGGVVRKNPSGSARLSGFLVDDDEARPGHMGGALELGYYDRSDLGVPSASPDADTYAGIKTRNDLSRPRSGYWSAAWGDPTAVGQVSAMVLHQRVDAFQEFSPIGLLTHDNRVVIENTTGRLRYDKTIEPIDLDVGVYGGFALGNTAPEQRLSTGTAGLEGIILERRNTAALAGASAMLRLGASSILVGYDMLHDEDEGDTVFNINERGDRVLRARGEKVTFTDHGLYLQGVYYPTEWLGFTGGLRYGINSSWGNALNARVAAVVTPIPELTLKALYGSSFVPPAPNQLVTQPLRFGGVQGNPDLESQTADTIEVAATGRITDYLSVTANGYATRINNRIEFVAAGTNLTADNLTESWTFGGEASVEARYDRYWAKAFFAYQYTIIEDPELTPFWWDLVYNDSGPNAGMTPGYPGWNGALQAGVLLAEAYLEVALAGKLVGPRKSSQANIRIRDEGYALDPYFRLDGNVRTMGLELIPGRETHVALRFTNLLGAGYADAGSLGADIPAVGRTVYLMIGQDL